MTMQDQDNDRREAYRRLADPSIYRDGGGRSPEETSTAQPPVDGDGARPGAPAEDTSTGQTAVTSYDREPRSAQDNAHYAEARQYERFGGVNWGAGFYGWLVTVSMTVLLTGVVGAVIGVLDRTVSAFPSLSDLAPTTLAIAAAATMVVVVMTAHFCGGYVAGRLCRFDGGRQGAGVWLTGVMLSALVVGASLLLGWQAGALDRIDLPTVELPPEILGLGGVAAAVAALLGSLLAAVGGGRVGVGYHRKVDDYYYEATTDPW